MADARDSAIRFVLGLARAIHTAGAPAHRLEEAMAELSPVLGMEGQFLATPTSVLAAFGTAPDQRTYLMRVEPGTVDLGRLASLDELIADVKRGALDADAGLARLAAIEQEPERYGPALTSLCFGIASAGAARFFGGGARELATAGAIGLLISALAAVTRRLPATARLFEPAAAALAALVAGAASAATGGHVSPYVASVAGLIVLVPGLSLTSALTELATRNLVAGTARLAGVTMTFLGIGGGLALGAAIASRLWHVPPNPVPVPLPAWTEWLALALSPLALGVLFRARASEGGWIVLVALLGYGTARFATGLAGPELGTFLAAAVVGVASNVYAQALRRVSAVPLVPAILMLIPGSIGIRSISSLIARDVVAGVALAFTLVIAAVSLAAGLLFANVAMSPRRRT